RPESRKNEWPAFRFTSDLLTPVHPDWRSMRLRILARARDSVLVTMLAIFGVVACKGRRTAESGGEVAQTWTPNGAPSALSVPRAAVTAAIQTTLAEKPPASVAKETWSRAKKLYDSYKKTPLWLTADGLDKPRAGALMLALADG